MLGPIRVAPQLPVVSKESRKLMNDVECTVVVGVVLILMTFLRGRRGNLTTYHQ